VAEVLPADEDVDPEDGPWSGRWNCFRQRGVILYLDMYEDLGAEAMLTGELYASNPVRVAGSGGSGGGSGSTAQFDILHSLYQQLSLHGAVIANHLHSGVTHVVMLPPASRAIRVRTICFSSTLIL
jgi:hypothetical protein